MRLQGSISACSERRLLTFLSAVCFLFGATLVLLGASQAEMARDLGLSLAQSGLLV